MGVNPYVFIVGCPRSGTTLLRRMVDAHPQLAITPETHWIPRLYRMRAGLSDDGRVSGELIAALRAERRFPKLGVQAEWLEQLLAADGPLSYAQVVSAIFDLYGQRRGTELVGDKTPSYVRHIDLLHDLWPQARFVHLVRDGRDVCLSALSWTRMAERFRRRFPTWDEDPVTTAALWWRWNVAIGRQAGARLGPDRYHEVRYEALVEHPAAECRRLCAFLGVAYAGTMLHFHEGRTRTDPGLSSKRAWLPPTPGLRDWRTQMPPEAIERFEAVAGDLLDDLGYERGVPTPRRERLQHAAKARQAFREDMVARSRTRPLPRACP